jgi:hypothetical protein
MSKVARFMETDPTTTLREFLSDYRRTLDVQEQIQLDRLLDELDTETDWYYSQNELNKGRLRQAEADARLRYQPFWAGVSAVERIFSKIADAAREQRWAVTARERERMTVPSEEPRALDRLRSAHEAAKGKGDAGAWEVWDTVADILGDPEIQFKVHRARPTPLDTGERG